MAGRRIAFVAIACGSCTAALGLTIAVHLKKCYVIHPDTVERKAKSFLHLYAAGDCSIAQQGVDITRSSFDRAKQWEHGEPRMLAMSSDVNAHDLAIRRLCKMHDLSDNECVTAAQSCDHLTLIGLARCRGADQRYFLSACGQRFVQHAANSDLVTGIATLLNGILRESSLDACTKHFTDLLLLKVMLLKHSGHERLQRGFTDHTYADKMSEHEVAVTEALLEWFLRVLYLQSSQPELRQKVASYGGLQLMQSIIAMHPGSASLQSTVAGVIGNLALDLRLREPIVQAGLLAPLAEWLQSENSLVCCKAATALSNLDREGVDDEAYEPGVCVLHPVFGCEADATVEISTDVDVVFVHGLRGGPVKTWRQSDACRYRSDGTIADDYCDCWPKKWLAADCPRARILTVEYDSALTEWTASTYCPHDKRRRTIEQRGEDLLAKLLRAGVGLRPIVWVGHSLGALLIEQALLHAARRSDCVEDGSRCSVVANTRAVVFCSAPHRGSSLAALSRNARYLLYPATEVQELRTGSYELAELRRSFDELARSAAFKRVDFYETQKTKLGRNVNVLLVPGVVTGSGENESKSSYCFLDEDHLGTSKPRNKLSPLYTTVLSLVRAAASQTT